MHPRIPRSARMRRESGPDCSRAPVQVHPLPRFRTRNITHLPAWSRGSAARPHRLDAAVRRPIDRPGRTLNSATGPSSGRTNPATVLPGESRNTVIQLAGTSRTRSRVARRRQIPLEGSAHVSLDVRLTSGYRQPENRPFRHPRKFPGLPQTG
jgi:hypothetical protein